MMTVNQPQGGLDEGLVLVRVIGREAFVYALYGTAEKFFSKVGDREADVLLMRPDDTLRDALKRGFVETVEGRLGPEEKNPYPRGVEETPWRAMR